MLAKKIFVKAVYAKKLEIKEKRNSLKLKVICNGTNEITRSSCIQRTSRFYFRNGALNGLFFDKRPKTVLQNPARCHSKVRKMETNDPRELKLGLK